MKIKIKQCGKSYTLCIKSLDKMLKHLNKQYSNIEVIYEYWDQTGILPTFSVGTLDVDIICDDKEIRTMHFLIYWKANGKPVVLD